MRTFWNTTRLVLQRMGLALLLNVALLAGDEASDKTAGALNGNFWKTCSPAIKTGFVVGFDSAIRAATTISKEEASKYSAAITYGEIVKSLDDVYTVPDNASLPIWVAFRIVILKARGIPNDKIGEQLVQDGVWRRSQK